MNTTDPTLMEIVLGWINDRWIQVSVLIVVGWLARHFGGMVITRIIKRVIRSTPFNPLSQDDITKRQDTLISLFIAVWKVFVTTVIAVTLFRILFPNIDLTPFFASAGILGVALGFGAQSLIKDFLTGVFIILENQYRVGDVVDLEGAAGTVERITIRSTVIRDADGNVHYLPNGNVMHVINKTMGFSKVNFTIVVAADTNIDNLTEVINKVGDKLAADEAWKDKVISAPHFLNIGSFTDVALEVTIMGKTQPSAQWSVTGEMRRRLLRAFKRHKIELAQLPIAGPWAPQKK